MFAIRVEFIFPLSPVPSSPTTIPIPKSWLSLAPLKVAMSFILTLIPKLKTAVMTKKTTIFFIGSPHMKSPAIRDAK